MVRLEDEKDSRRAQAQADDQEDSWPLGARLVPRRWIHVPRFTKAPRSAPLTRYRSPRCRGAELASGTLPRCGRGGGPGEGVASNDRQGRTEAPRDSPRPRCPGFAAVVALPLSASADDL